MARYILFNIHFNFNSLPNIHYFNTQNIKKLTPYVNEQTHLQSTDTEDRGKQKQTRFIEGLLCGQ